MTLVQGQAVGYKKDQVYSKNCHRALRSRAKIQTVIVRSPEGAECQQCSLKSSDPRMYVSHLKFPIKIVVADSDSALDSGEENVLKKLSTDWSGGQ